VRYALLAVLLAVMVYAGCGASNPTCTGNGATTGCSGNGQGGGNPGPAPSGAVYIPKHIFDISYVGSFLAGVNGTVTQAQIQANVSIGHGARVGLGADRSVSSCNHALSNWDTGCQASVYFDLARADASTSGGFGSAMLAQGGASAPYSEGVLPVSAPAAWFLHTALPQAPTTRATPLDCTGNFPNCVYSTNFANTLTAQWMALCAQGQVVNNSLNTTTTGPCNGQSPSGTGDTGGGQTYDAADVIFFDTFSTSMVGMTKGLTTTSEIGADPALANAQAAWFPIAFKHKNGGVFNVNVNGLARVSGQTMKAENGIGACHYNTGSDDCYIMLGFSPVTGGTQEFFCQNSTQGWKSEFCAWYINSATQAIGLGKQVWQLSEYDSTHSAGCGTTCTAQVGETANHILALYVASLLTYQPSKPTAEAVWLDVDKHCTNQNCSDGSGPEASNHLSAWPIENLVPYGSMAIGMTPYVCGGSNCTTTPTGGIGLAGCTPSENDSGGIIPYLVPGTCGNADDGVENVGVYCNATDHMGNAGVALGAAVFCLNLTNAAVTIPTSEITALGALLPGAPVWGVGTFTHQVDIGQSAATLQDNLNGGTMTVATLGFTSGMTQIASDSGMIITP
jgi:hypothetical protein